ncbi:MAG: branched-chain amino acid transport system II carrier protein, partial [Oscillospiraceae bacterium]
LAGIVSSLGLFFVYCGLAFLGASVSTAFPPSLTQAELLIGITKGVLGQEGVVLLGIIVAAACLTTAIGLVSSCAGYFTEVTGGKIKYTHGVIVISLISLLVSNLGISKIIAFAAPILDLIYPVLVVLVFMALFSEKIHNGNIYKGAALGAFLCGALTLVETYLTGTNFLSLLPFSAFGFGWILPALLGGIFGSLLKPCKS